jgi:hypothetical protein
MVGKKNQNYPKLATDKKKGCHIFETRQLNEHMLGFGSYKHDTIRVSK